MKKSFKLTQRPRQSASPPSTLPPSPAGEPAEASTVTHLEHPTRAPRAQTRSVSPHLRSSRPAGEMSRGQPQGGRTTRKTIEVPEEYFFRVKMRAVQRRMKEKDIWAEILEEYFSHHPDGE
jgi:hypothetical protein